MKKLLQARWLQSPITLTLYLIFITALFMLPGSALPKSNWFTKVNFDKWVHIGFFIALLFLLLSVIKQWGESVWKSLLLAAVYGAVIELIQHFFIANRAFDAGDWMADMAGSLLGLLLWRWVYKKNKPL